MEVGDESVNVTFHRIESARLMDNSRFLTWKMGVDN